MTMPRNRGHSEVCRHPRFDLYLGDRAVRDHTEALTLAHRRAPKRGRQTVRRHVGQVLKKAIWFVQDIRDEVTT